MEYLFTLTYIYNIYNVFYILIKFDTATSFLRKVIFEGIVCVYV